MKRDPSSSPFLKGGLRGIFICHYPAAKPGERMGMLGESRTGNGLRGSSIANQEWSRIVFYGEKIDLLFVRRSYFDSIFS
jgi:hypothetical protein